MRIPFNDHAMNRFVVRHVGFYAGVGEFSHGISFMVRFADRLVILFSRLTVDHMRFFRSCEQP